MKKIYLFLIILVLVVTGCDLAVFAGNNQSAETDKKSTTSNPVAVVPVEKPEPVQASGTAALLARTKVAQKTDQIVLVCGHQLSLWNRREGIWTEQLSTYAGYGYNGYSAAKREGDGATPVGCYPLPYAFGKENPGTLLPYRQITQNSWFSSALGDGTYNTWVERPQYVKGEHLADYAHKQYYYAIMIGYNINPIVENHGSAIFLHCKGNSWNTAGCISVEQPIMRTLMVSVKPGAWIIMTTSEDALKNY